MIKVSWLKENWFKAGLLIAILILGGSYLYIDNKSAGDGSVQGIVEESDLLEKESEIEELRSRLELLKKQEPQERTVIREIPVEVTREDPVIKIEKCKAQAKAYADQIAKRDYLLAFERALAEGENEAAQMYLEFSYGPDHPADYDSNYSSEYIKCLDN